MRRITNQNFKTPGTGASRGSVASPRRFAATMLKRGWVPAGALLLALALGGCGYSRMGPQRGHDAAANGAAPPRPRWPENYTQLPTLHAELAIDSAQGKKPWMTVEAGPAGQGWISYRLPAVPEGADAAAMIPESFHYAAWREAPSALALPSQTSELERILVLEASAPFRMGFKLFMPYKGEARGLIIHQWGLSGPKYEQTVVDALRHDGWAVLAYNGMYWRQPGALTLAGDSPDALANVMQQNAMPMNSDQKEQSLEASVNAAAELAANDFDDAIGQYVLAHEAALEFVRRHVPSIPVRPLVVVGCSFGSLMTPALVTRLGDQVSACVLVGSGGSFLRVTGTSWQDAYYSRVRRGSAGKISLPALKREEMYESYLDRASLDPLHTAAALREIPTLMLHARWDMIVPASTGDALWERAGRPERWSGPFGHLFMFMNLGNQADDLVEWIDRATGQQNSAR
ncbi:MAG: alpha/beta hydrolase [Planctomycetota bacterium]|nr:alpha/beta hydrolase [Planctomycetota bacterium]